MLAKPVKDLPGSDLLPGGCVYEPKWDGYRALLFVGTADDGAPAVRLQSRRGGDYTTAFPDIAAAAVVQVPMGTVLDGELLVWGDGRLDFSALQQRAVAVRRAGHLARRHPATFMAFDVLAVDGRDCRARPLRQRRRYLEGLLPALAPPLQVTPATADLRIAARWRQEYVDAQVGIEGLVIKGLAEPYRPGQRGWLKLRTRASAEAVVGAVTGSVEHPDRLILGLYDHGVLVVAGGTGPLRPGQAREVAGFLTAADPEQHPWPPELPGGRTGGWSRARRLPVTLVTPDLVVEISADSAFERMAWRHVVRYVRVRLDRLPSDASPPGDSA